MEYYQFDVRTVRLPQFAQASTIGQVTWLKALCYCVESENSGVIVGAAKWSDATWVSVVGITKKDVIKSAPLITFNGDNVEIWGFPHNTFKEVERTRRNASVAAKARWADHNALKQNGSAGNADASVSHMPAPSGGNPQYSIVEDSRVEHTPDAGSEPSSNPIPDREAERTLPESLARFPGMRELWREWVAYCVERNHGKHPPTQTFDAHLKTLITCADRGGWPAVEDGVRRAVEMNFRAPLASEKNAYGGASAPDTNTNYANPPVPGLDPFNIPGDISFHLAQRDLLAPQNSGIATGTTA